MLVGPGACSLERKTYKHCNLVHSELSKVCYYDRIINQQPQNLIAIFFSKTNPDVHASTKISTIVNLQGGGG